MTSPETDAFLIEGGNYSYAGLADFARRLERERDEARETLRELVDEVARDTTRPRPVRYAEYRARAILAKGEA